MSLELAIQENTAALKGVMELLQRYMQKEVAPVAAPEKKRKAATVAAPAAQADPEGTRYWHIAKHNSVYKQLPDMADCNISDAVEVTETEYQVQKALIEQKVAAPAAAPAAAPVLQVVHSAPVVAEPAPEPQVTYAEVVDAIKAYFRAFGNGKVVELLSTFSVSRVPELESQPEIFADVVAQVQAKLGN